MGMQDGLRKVRKVEDLTVGDTVKIDSLTSGFYGYYWITRIDERAGKPVLNLIPEKAWGITDPAKRKSYEIAVSFTHFWSLFLVDAHAPSCRVCGELWPCQHVQDVRSLDRSISELEEQERKRNQSRVARKKYKARYSLPGVCPACQRPVSFGQPFRTFDVNAVISNGPPVTYHLSSMCAADIRHHSMHDYMNKLKKKEKL